MGSGPDWSDYMSGLDALGRRNGLIPLLGIHWSVTNDLSMNSLKDVMSEYLQSSYKYITLSFSRLGIYNSTSHEQAGDLSQYKS